MSACTPPWLGGLTLACLSRGLALPAWEWTPALPTLLPGLRLSIACLGMSACTPPGLRFRSPRTLKSHQQATPTLDCPCRPGKESPTLQPAWEWVPALLLGWGLALPAWEWTPALPALLPGWVRSWEWAPWQCTGRVPLEYWGRVTNRQLWCQILLAEQRSHQWHLMPKKWAF